MNNSVLLLNRLLELQEQKYQFLLQMDLLTQEQINYFLKSDDNLERFDYLLAQKELSIEQLDIINNEFEDLLEKNKKHLGYGLEEVQQQIEMLRHKTDQITKITERIKTNEKTVKNHLDIYLNSKRVDVKNFRTNKSAASKYNQHMKNTHQNEMSYFMDKKK